MLPAWVGKFGTWFAKAILIPELKELAISAYKKTVKYLKLKKEAEENSQRAEEYEDNPSDDSFNNRG